MPGTFIFYTIILLSFGLFIGLSFFKLRGQQYFVHDGLVVAFRVGIEHSILAIIFASLPFLMYELLEVRTVMWDLASLILSVVMFLAWLRIMYTAYLLQIKWQTSMVIIVALYSIIGIITLANAIWWNTLEVYVLGVIWMVGVALAQLFTLVYFDPDPIAKKNSIRYYYHGFLHSRLWRNRRSGRPNRPSDNYAVAHTDSVDYTRRERYTNGFPFTRPPKSNRRSVAHTALRTYTDS